IFGLSIALDGLDDIRMDALRVLNGFQNEAVFLESRDAEECRLTSKSNNEIVIIHAGAVCKVYLLLLQLNTGYGINPNANVGPFKQFVQRKGYVLFMKMANSQTMQFGNDLMGRIFVNESNFCFVAVQITACRQSSEQTAVTAAEYQY